MTRRYTLLAWTAAAATYLLIVGRRRAHHRLRNGVRRSLAPLQRAPVPTARRHRHRDRMEPPVGGGAGLGAGGGIGGICVVVEPQIKFRDPRAAARGQPRSTRPCRGADPAR